jgi:outer membrane protein assembly factor BamB
MLKVSAITALLFATYLHSPCIAGFTGSLNNNDSVKTMQLLWTLPTKGKIFSSAVFENGLIYVASEDKNVYAVEPSTGSVRWTFATRGSIYATPCVKDKSLFILSMDGHFYALNAENGKLLWTFKTGGEKQLDIWDYYASGAIVRNGLVYFGSSDNNIYALNTTSGKLIWKYKTGDMVHGDPVLKNDTLFAGDFNGGIYAVNATTGKAIWRFQTVGDRYFPKGEVQKGLLLEGNTLFAGSRDYNIYALDANSGRAVWNMKEPGSWVIATPLYFNGRLYFGTSDSHMFYCMDANYGVVLWKMKLNMRVYGSAVENNGIIYFGCFNGKLYGVDGKTGKLLSMFQNPTSEKNYSNVYDITGEIRKDVEMYGDNYKQGELKILSLGSFMATPLLHDGILYMGASDGNFYAINLN